MEDVISKADVELRTHFRELPSHLRLPASPKVPMLPHICLFQYVPPDHRNFNLILDQN